MKEQKPNAETYLLLMLSMNALHHTTSWNGA